MALNLTALVDGAYKHGASDIHLTEGCPVYLRIDGVLRPVKSSPLTREDLQQFLNETMPSYVQGDLDTKRGADYAWQPDERMRFRVAVFFERDHLTVVMRLIKTEIASLDDLGLPEVMKEIASQHRGVVIMTGVTGSGKSTTLAGMIRYINEREPRRIITIEDPIEMVHPNIKSLISQREVGRDVEGFRAGLVQALRQDPDVILIGEMRNPDTISTALRAAETGHLVMSTLHTSNAVHTIERILGEFPETAHAVLRDQLANNLKATITQRLVRRISGGRAAALEIMRVDGMIKKLLLDNDIVSISTVIRQRREGMMLFDQHLADMVREKVIDEATAYEFVEDEAAFRRYIKGRMATADMGGILGA